MSRILLAWELGAGVGHLAAFRPLAEALLARGHQLTVAAQDIGSGMLVFGDLPVQLLPAPVCTRQYGGLAEPPLNYAEILMRYGYLDSAMLKALLRGWRGVLELSDAALVVADHAPTALLAARGRAIGRCAFGSPFLVPPPVSPTPNMRDWLTVPAQRLQSSDASVIGAINAALEPGQPPLQALHELFEGVAALFVGIPELDPYGPRAPDHFLGLHAGRSAAAAVSWPAGGGPRLFAYVRMDYPHIEACLAALAASAARCVVNLVGATPEIIARYGGPRLTFSEGHVDMEVVAAQCDAAVCHSGMGMVNALLRAGKPLLLLPGHLEQFLLSRNVARLGAALVVTPETAAQEVGGALQRLLTDPVVAGNARALAQRCALPSAAAVIDKAVARIEACIAEAAA